MQKRTTISVLLIAGLMIGTTGIAFAVNRQITTQSLTVGPVPRDTKTVNGVTDIANVPDLIPVSDNSNKVVGYSYKADVFRTSDAKNPTLLGQGVMEVWDVTGQKLVGHVWPNGIGFRSLTDRSPVPSTTTPATILMRP